MTLLGDPDELGALAGAGLVNVLIDTPRGSRNKYKFDAARRCFRLSRTLPAGAQFPFDFGAIPGTRAEDGDALDVLVLMDAPTFPGCLLAVRLLGVIGARQAEQRGRPMIRNDRLIGVPVTAVNRPRQRSLGDLDPALLHEVEQFFAYYNRVQGRRFELTGRQGPVAARRLLERAIRNFATRDSERKR